MCDCTTCANYMEKGEKKCRNCANWTRAELLAPVNGGEPHSFGWCGALRHLGEFTNVGLGSFVSNVFTWKEDSCEMFKAR